MKLDATQKRIQASDILEALRVKHSEDVFVPECKDGPSQFSEHFRLDAWTMNRSWANAVVTGYEIKVNRSDFVKDEKWRAYLPLCNQFYFVCPRGLIVPSELSPEVGLYYCSSTGNRLLIQKKAVHREVEIPETLWRYILMRRSAITRDRWTERDPRDQWRDFLKKKAEDRELGYEVAKAIRERATQLEIENERLRKTHERYDEIIAWLEKIGIKGYATTWNVERRLDELRKAVPPELSTHLTSLIRCAEQMRQQLAAIEQSDA